MQISLVKDMFYLKPLMNFYPYFPDLLSNLGEIV